MNNNNLFLDIETFEIIIESRPAYMKLKAQ